jgi:signal transduction histidine kinase
MTSIQSRLSTGLTISLIAMFITLWLLISNGVQSLAENYIASRLHHDIETILTSIEFDKNKTLILNSDRIDTIYNRPFSGHYYTIQHKNNEIRSRSLWDQTLKTRTPDIGKYITSYQTGPEKQILIIVSAQFFIKNNPITISAAEDTSPIIVDIEKFKKYFTVISVGILLALLILHIIILRHGLKPLNTIKLELEDLEKGKIQQLSRKAPGELKPLIDEINHLLNILNQRLKRSRDALSDLSHSIKKPLTVLQQLNKKDKHNDIEDSKTMSNQINNIQQLTDRILKRARLAGNAYSGVLFDFNDDLNDLLKTIKSIYPDKPINLDTNIQIIKNTGFDREDILELLGNLLDNAYKWANTKILVSIYESDGLHITIEDDGTGSEHNQINQLIKRGVRLDENISGYGFGLAIASDIVKDYKGKLSFEKSDSLGGFKVNITLPGNH